MDSINSSNILSYQREKLQFSEYILIFFILFISVLIDFLANDFTISLRKYTIVIIMSFIIILIYNYNIITMIILKDNNIIIKKSINRVYTYKIKDITVSEKEKLTNTLVKYYVLLIKGPDDKKFRIHSTYWPKYFELKEVFVKLGVCDE